MQGIIGGGVSGLSAAYYLTKFCEKPVKLIEASSRVGGWIKSSQTPSGHVFEQGARTIRPKGEQGENTLTLISELGLSQKIVPIPASHPAARNRLIYVDNKLHSLPSNLMSLFLPQTPFTKPIVSAIFKDLKTPKKVIDDESIYNFSQRRLGKEIADYLVSPLICGVCAGDAKEISVKFLMNALFEAEQNHGSITSGMLHNMWQKIANKSQLKNDNVLYQRAIKEKWSVYSLIGGLEVLTQKLDQKIREQGVEVLLNSPCTDIIFTNDNIVIVKAGNKTFTFDNIICSLPAMELATLLQKQFPDLGKKLASIPAVTVGVVNFQYDTQVIDKDAFGFLVPPSENLPILGVTFDSCCFPKGNSTVLTVMMGGRWFEKLFGVNPNTEDLFEIATSQLKSILGINAKPKMHSVSILRHCIPQYVIGHQDRLQAIRNDIKKYKLPLTLIGASYDGVGVNDVILSAKKAVNHICNIN